MTATGGRRGGPPARIALGIVPHTGWAWLVRVGGTRSAARIEARARIVACDVLDGRLYHLAAERTHDRAEFLGRRRAVAVAQACRALEPHLGEARAAVVLGKEIALPPLERIVAAHPLIHGAEGELWRAVFAEACVARSVSVTRAVAEDVRSALAKRPGGAAIAAFLAQGRRDVGSPWSREPQDAALAAWSLLQSGKRDERPDGERRRGDRRLPPRGGSEARHRRGERP